MRLTSTLAVSLLFTAASLGFAQHRLITQGNDKLAIVGKDGKIEWEMKWGVLLQTTLAVNLAVV